MSVDGTVCFAVPVGSVLVIAATQRELCTVDGARTMCCGIGPVEAAAGTASALRVGAASAVLHVGIAGSSSLDAGTVVIGSESIYCDVLDPNATLPRVSRLTPSPGLFEVVRGLLPHAVTAPIATAARVGGGEGYPVEAMEGFGVLRAAALAGVPAVEVRVVSNHPATTDRRRWHTEQALEVLHGVIATLVAGMSD